MNYSCLLYKYQYILCVCRLVSGITKARIVQVGALSDEAETSDRKDRSESKTIAIEARTPREFFTLVHCSLFAFTRSVHELATFGNPPTRNSSAPRNYRNAALTYSLAGRCFDVASFAQLLAVALNGQLLGNGEARRSRHQLHQLAQSSAAHRL